MKKSIVTGLLTLLLIGCASPMDDFVKNYNEKAKEYGISELSEAAFGEIERAEELKWQTLFESDDYQLDTLYDEDRVNGYFLKVYGDKPSIDENSQGYLAALSLASALDLDLSTFENGIEEALDEDFTNYDDQAYNVNISFIDLPDDALIVIVEKIK